MSEEHENEADGSVSGSDFQWTHGTVSAGTGTTATGQPWLATPVSGRARRPPRPSPLGDGDILLILESEHAVLADFRYT
jgi:hypothetical protein